MVLPKIFIRKYQCQSQGFSLAEVLLVLALMSVLAGTTMIFSLGSYSSARMNQATKKLAGLLITARSDAMNNMGGVAHGVAFNQGGYNGWVLFAGSDFASADEGSKVFVPRPEGISLGSSTPSQIIFSPQGGGSNYAGTIDILGGPSSSSTIKINYEGAISY